MGIDELYASISRALEIDHLYVTHLQPEQTEQIALVRSLGRKAGRELGWRVRTVESEPAARSDGKVVVVVAVVVGAPEDEERIRERDDLLLRNIKWPG